MPAIDQEILAGYIAVGVNAETTTERGKALEDLICYVFSLMPGVAVTHRNVMNEFRTEEVDVALWVDEVDGGIGFLKGVVLIEAKNWSNNVSSIEVAWFDTKVKHRGLDFGLLVTVSGITGDLVERSRAHQIVALALAERRRLIVITTAELQALPDTSALALLIKTKLCELTVTGGL